MRASEDMALSAVRRIDDFNFYFKLHSGPGGWPGANKDKSQSRLFRARVSDIILHEVKAHQHTMCSLDHLVYMIYRKTCLFFSGKKVPICNQTLQPEKLNWRSKDDS